MEPMNFLGMEITPALIAAIAQLIQNKQRLNLFADQLSAYLEIHPTATLGEFKQAFLSSIDMIATALDLEDTDSAETVLPQLGQILEEVGNFSSTVSMAIAAMSGGDSSQVEA